MRDEMDRIFGRVAGEVLPTDGQKWSPWVDVREENGHLIVKADLPSVKKEDVEITATEDAITIEGRSQEETEEQKAGYLPPLLTCRFT